MPDLVNPHVLRRRLAAAALAVLALDGAGMAAARAQVAAPSAEATERSVEDLYRAGSAARGAGRFDEAIELLSRVTTLQPEHADAQVQLGLALSVRGRRDEAGRAFRRALAEAPAYDDARLGLARLALWAGDLDGAAQELARLGERAAEGDDVRLLRDQVAAARTEARLAAPAPQAPAASPRESAAPAPAKVAPANPTTPAKPAVAAKPAAPTADPLAAATAHRRAGRFPQAEAAYRAILARFPRDADRWVDLGLVRAFQGPKRFADARSAFDRALALAPDSLDAVLGLARVDLYESALDACEERIGRVLAKVPDHYEALGLRARLRLARGDAAGAETDFAGLVGRDPRNAEALTGLGDARRAQYRDAEALESFRQALAIDPRSEDIRKRLEAPIRPRWALAVNGGGSRLTTGFKPWSEGGIHLGYRLDALTTITGGVEVNERFGKTDTLLDARLDRRWSDVFASYFRVGATPAADYRPTFLTEAGGSARLLKGTADGTIGATVATVDLGYARYAGAGSVESASVGIEQYVWRGRLWFTAKAIGTVSATNDRLSGYLVRADLLVVDGVQLFVGYADAPDSSDGRVYPSRTLFGGAIWTATDTLTVRLSAAREDRDNSYDRTTVNLGLSVGF